LKSEIHGRRMAGIEEKNFVGVWKQLNSGNNFETIKNWIGKH
jgi:hypothetical protein